MSDPTLLILSIGSVVLTLLGTMKCIKSFSSFCCTIQMADEKNPIDPLNPVSIPVVQKTQLMNLVSVALVQRFTPRTAKTIAQPNAQPNAILVQSPCASDSIVMSV